MPARHALRSVILSGLHSIASKPTSLACSLQKSSSPLAEKPMIRSRSWRGTRCSRSYSRMARVVWIPSSTGICTSIMTHAGLKGACGCVSMRMASWPSLAARSSSAPHLESIVSVSQRNVGSSSTTSTGPRLSSTCSSAPTSATLPGGERGCAYGCARGCAYEASEAAASVEGEVLCGACLGASGDGACADAAGETASAADERVGERVGESAGECAAECAGESANVCAGACAAECAGASADGGGFCSPASRLPSAQRETGG
mmetsp:Transcript_18297/g.38707  ORF Transcript_18297/g.38707 Transcript_18297/m.38707 type:complete len:261 (-) Transcript_18297:2248-3030(-)